MAQAAVWFQNNDMLVNLNGVRSSTMSTGSYLNNSTGVKLSIWRAVSTASTADRIVNSQSMAYQTGTLGNYQYKAESTAMTSLVAGVRGMVVITLAHQGLNGEWRPDFRVEKRRTT